MCRFESDLRYQARSLRKVAVGEGAEGGLEVAPGTFCGHFADDSAQRRSSHDTVLPVVHVQVVR